MAAGGRVGIGVDVMEAMGLDGSGVHVGHAVACFAASALGRAQPAQINNPIPKAGKVNLLFRILLCFIPNSPNVPMHRGESASVVKPPMIPPAVFWRVRRFGFCILA
jgi:hypothetical protein